METASPASGHGPGGSALHMCTWVAPLRGKLRKKQKTKTQVSQELFLLLVFLLRILEPASGALGNGHSWPRLLQGGGPSSAPGEARRAGDGGVARAGTGESPVKAVVAGGRGRQCEKGRLQPPRQAPVCWAEPPGDPTSLEATVVTIRGQRHRVFPAETQETAKTGNTHRGASQAPAPWNGPVTRGQGLGRGGRTERGAPAAGGSWGTAAPLPRRSCSQRGAVLAV